MEFLRMPDDSGLNHFNGTTKSVASAALVAHLRGEFFLLGEFSHLARFPDSLGQRLLAINMFAEAHRSDGGGAMHVVGRRNRDGVNGFAHFIEHFTPIAIKLRVVGATSFFGHSLERLVLAIQSIRVDVADRDDVASSGKCVRGVAITFSANSDAGDADAVISAENIADKREGGGRGLGSQRGWGQKRAGIQNLFFSAYF